MLLDTKWIEAWPLPAVPSDIDKNERGRVLLVGGSREVPGAVLLAAESALRAGAGKVTVATSSGVAREIAMAMPELRVVGLQDLPGGGLRLDDATLQTFINHYDAVLIGPGMQDEAAVRALVKVLATALPSTQWIFDAAAIGAIRHLHIEIQPRAITPHAGEMAHFHGVLKETVCAHLSRYARQTAAEWQCFTALKGATTLIATPDGRLFRHDGGHSGLAMSGSGDCLAGIIAGLAARGVPLEQACAWGVFVHGRAGELLAEQYGGIGFLAREIPAQIPKIIHGVLAPA